MGVQNLCLQVFVSWDNYDCNYDALRSTGASRDIKVLLLKT